MIIVKILGGLGNQMFQYAFYRSLKEVYSNTRLDILSFKNYKLHNGYELERIFKNIKPEYANLNDVEKLSDCKMDIISRVRRKCFGVKKTYFREKYYGYNKGLEFIGDKYLDGYWQSAKYFRDIENIIKEEFTFEPLDEKRNLSISEKITGTNSISVHIRRGDYVNHPLYANICTEEYYQKAINYMKNSIENPVFYVFSDEISWCQNALDLSTHVEYIDWNKGGKSYRDMQLMSMCKHNIIANSTFSWWGAWLNSNPGKLIVAPNRMMNSINDAIDLIPETWVQF